MLPSGPNIARALERPGVHLAKFGGVGNESFDNYAALMNAHSALPSTGGNILLGSGTFNYGTKPTFTKPNVTLIGEGGRTGGAYPATRVQYTGSGSVGMEFQGIGSGLAHLNLIKRTAESFTGGTLLKVSNDWFSTFDVMLQLAVDSGGVAAALGTPLALAGTTCGQFYSTTFDGGQWGCIGNIGMPATNGGIYSTNHTFVGCTWKDCVTACFRNPADSFTYLGCTFQELASGAPGSFITDAGFQARGFGLFGGWHGDSWPGGSPPFSGSWIKISGVGIDIGGGVTFGNSNYAVEIGNDSASSGVRVGGAVFNACSGAGVRSANASNERFNVGGNSLYGGTTVEFSSVTGSNPPHSNIAP